MGLGGDVTVLQCHIEHADTHMTLNPVAVNYQCWAPAARAPTSAAGDIDYDREARDELCEISNRRSRADARRIGSEGGGMVPTQGRGAVG